MALAAALSARFLSFVAFAFVCVFLLFSKDCIEHSFPLSPSTQTEQTVPADADSIHNSTLGFQRIFVTIPPEQLEQKIRLEQAANQTDISLTMLEGTKDDEFREGERLSRCHRICAYEQKSLWRRIVNEGISSALLMSGDAAWDARIRSQLVGFSIAAKSIANGSANFSLQDGPYSNDWDLLWLGHCGKISEGFSSATNNATKGPHASTWTTSEGHPLEYPHASTDICLTSDLPIGKLCLSSYAVSDRGAAKLLRLAEYWKGPMAQYLMERCQDGDVKCIIQWPQIMSQVDIASKSVVPYEELSAR